MYHYELYGMNICSDLEFSQLCPGHSQPQVIIEQAQMPLEISGSERGQYAFGSDIGDGITHKNSIWLFLQSLIGFIVSVGPSPVFRLLAGSVLGRYGDERTDNQ